MSEGTGESARDEIRAAALTLFSSIGFHGTGIRRIAQEAGVSLATLYHYMSSKEDLLVEEMTENIQSLVRDARAELQGRIDPVDRLRALVGVHLATHIRDRMVCIVSDTEMRSLSPASRTQVVALRDEYESQWRSVVDAGVKAGDFSVEDVNIATKALLDMCTGIVHWYSPDGRLGQEDLTEMYVELCLGMLGAHSRSSGDES